MFWKSIKNSNMCKHCEEVYESILLRVSLTLVTGTHERKQLKTFNRFCDEKSEAST